MTNACKIHFNTHSNFYDFRPLFTTDIHNVLQMKKNTLYLHYNGSYNEYSDTVHTNVLFLNREPLMHINRLLCLDTGNTKLGRVHGTKPNTF